MSLFSFGSITFTENQTPSSSLNPGDYQILRYPRDVGATDKGHYVIFYINQQVKSQYSSSSALSVINRGDYFDPGQTTYIEKDSPSLNKSLNLAQSGMFTNGVNAKLQNGFGSSLKLTDISSNMARRIKRTSQAIALYMPDTLSFTNNQQYTDLSVGGYTSTAALATGMSIFDTLKDSRNISQAFDALRRNLVGNFSPFISYGIKEAFNKLKSGNVGDLINYSMFGATNPLLELIYTSPSFRNFNFEFMFYPRSEEEALEVQKIIGQFTFHQAPEIDIRNNGYFLIPPSEFDIEFKYSNVVNPNIQRISTCVLQSIMVDYAPHGFSAYEVPGNLTPELGGTGMPTAIRMTLNFRETQIVTKNDYQTPNALGPITTAPVVSNGWVSQEGGGP